MKTCFFVSRIGERESEQRGHSDKVLEHIIEPALNGLEYDTKRADHIEVSGTIHIDVLKHLLNSDLVIADLSGGNPNVFYELAVRHMTKLPFVQLVLEGESLPFDLASERTIRFSFDVADAKRATKDLRRMVEAASTDPGGCRSMLSAAVALSATGEGTAAEKPLTLAEKAVFTEILSRLQEIQAALTMWPATIPQSSLYYNSSMPGQIRPPSGKSLTPAEMAEFLSPQKFARVLDDLKKMPKIVLPQNEAKEGE